MLGRSSVREVSFQVDVVPRFPFLSVYKTTNIEVLKLTGSVTSPNLLCLANLLTKNSVIRVLAVSLSLHQNRQVLNALAVSIGVNIGLQDLTLEHLESVGDIAFFLSQALVANRTLQSLTIHGRNVSAGDVKQFAEALHVNQSLTCLKLKGEQPPNDRVEGFSDVLFEGDVSSRLHFEYGSNYIPLLTRLLRHGKLLGSVAVTCPGSVKASSMRCFFTSLRLDVTLTTLTVALECRFPSRSAGQLAYLLRTSKSLRDVALRLNICDTDICTLCEGIKVSEKILNLTLDHWSFNKGCEDAFFEMLKMNRSLINLTISDLESAAVDVVTRGLPTKLSGNRSLQTLNIFRSNKARIDNAALQTYLGENQHLLSMAVSYVDGTCPHPNFVMAFLLLARSGALAHKLKEYSGEPDAVVAAKIKLCLEHVVRKKFRYPPQ